jgi:AraC-like DNA-binding protein
MQNTIKRYQVQHPLLQKYIKFFWELCIEQIQLNHKIIPQRNINMRINLSNTPHYIDQENNEKRLDDVYFLGLQNKCPESHLKVNGDVDIIGICFMPYGFFPFLKIPVSEFKNQILGADEEGFKITKRINERLKESQDITTRLAILEAELLTLLDNSNQNLDQFQLIFNALIKGNPLQFNDFCHRNNISVRQLERFFSKYIGLSPNTYFTLDRFHCTLRELLNTNTGKLSDLAYDNEYYDQMHFIKEFKRYTGRTPKSFINQKNSILQISKFT